MRGVVSRRVGQIFRQNEAFTQDGLRWIDDRNWECDEKPASLRPRKINAFPGLLKQVLSFIGLMIRDEVPIHALDPKHVLGVSSQGHLVFIPHSTLSFREEGFSPNYKELFRPLRLFLEEPQVNATEYHEFARELGLLLNETYSEDINMRKVREMLTSHGFLVPKEISVPEINLCNVDTYEALLQALSEHPDYSHMVQAPDGELPNEIELAVDPDGPIAMAYHRISNSKILKSYSVTKDLEWTEHQGPYRVIERYTIRYEMEITCIEKSTFKRGRVEHEFVDETPKRIKLESI